MIFVPYYRQLPWCWDVTEMTTNWIHFLCWNQWSPGLQKGQVLYRLLGFYQILDRLLLLLYFWCFFCSRPGLLIMTQASNDWRNYLLFKNTRREAWQQVSVSHQCCLLAKKARARILLLVMQPTQRHSQVRMWPFALLNLAAHPECHFLPQQQKAFMTTGRVLCVAYCLIRFIG